MDATDKKLLALRSGGRYVSRGRYVVELYNTDRLHSRLGRMSPTSFQASQIIATFQFSSGVSWRISVKLTVSCLAFFFQLTACALAADVQSVQVLLQTKACPGCDLSGADLQEADLDKAYLEGANLTDALLREAHLNGAILKDAKLSRAHLDQAQLKKAILISAKLDGAHLQATDLTEAILNGADLSDAVLQLTELKGSIAYGTHLDRAIFEPISLPDIWSMRDVSGLDSIAWEITPRALNLLRDEFKKAAQWDQEKAVTYALREQDRLRQGIAARWFQKIFFEATSLWGASASRPLVIMFILIPVFGLAYSVAIVRRLSDAGIWQVWDKDRIQQDHGANAPTRLNPINCRPFQNALHFSILSAFDIGWKDLNIGNWIVRFSPHEYTLRGTGWVRTVSGFQSITSVYLLALAVLSYFGRPFE
jgi:hypothetical protein